MSESTVTINIRPNVVAALDRLAQEWGVSREQAANLCIVWNTRPDMVEPELLSPGFWDAAAKDISRALAKYQQGHRI